MAIVYNYIDINLANDLYIPSLDVVQGDTGRGIVFNILTPISGLDNEIASLTATLNVVKPNGETGSTTGTIESLGSNMARVTIEPSADYAALIDVAGTAKGNVEIAYSSTVITTFKISIKIQKNPFYPVLTTRKFDVSKVYKIDGVQQYEHEVQSIQFVNLDYDGDVYIVVSNTEFDADVETEGYSNTIPLTDYTFVLGQPMTRYSGVFYCQIFAEATPKFELSPVFQIVISPSVTQGEETEYPVDPNIAIAIENYLSQRSYGLRITANGNPLYIEPEEETAFTELKLYGNGTTSPVTNPIVKVWSKNVIDANSTGNNGRNVTWTVEDDGTIVANGTPSGAGICYISQDGFTLPAGTYIVSDDAASTHTDGGYVGYKVNGGSTVYVTASNPTRTFTLTENGTIGIWCAVPSGVTATDLKFKPMIRLSDADEGYVNYEGIEYSYTGSLLGIEVTSDGNYTDSNGQMWLADEWDIINGTITRYIDSSTYEALETPTTETVDSNLVKGVLPCTIFNVSSTEQSVVYSADLATYLGESDTVVDEISEVVG